VDEAALPPALVERVLERLGFAAAPAPERAGLASLYAAWCENVPFDNVRKRLHVAARDPGALPGDAPPGFFEDWLAYGTGGTCWAGNGALCALLQALGFRARRGMATMLAAPELPPNHGTVVVALDEGRFLVDASILCGAPLAIPEREGESTAVEHPAWGVVARRENGRVLVRWNALHRPALDCRVEAFEADAAEFRTRHEATRGWSPFNFSLSARRNRAGGVIGAGLGQRAEIVPDGTHAIRPFEPGERTRLLVEALGIAESVAAALPPDEPLPPPPAP
jgi:N-hydroxyarylamine O-acetyltransferase